MQGGALRVPSAEFKETLTEMQGPLPGTRNTGPFPGRDDHVQDTRRASGHISGYHG